MSVIERLWTLVLTSLASLGVMGCDSSTEPSEPSWYGGGTYTPGPSGGARTVDAEVPPPEPGQCQQFECVPPTCCGAACTGDAECCQGTYCSPDGNCIPNTCRGCGGFAPFCSYDLQTCVGECVAPPTCGEACNEATPCGPGTLCNQFDSGESYCVPDAYEETCRAMCGGGGGSFTCHFDFASCDVSCAPPAPPTPPACCLDACTGDGDCCEGTFCGSSGRCIPAGCQSCDGLRPFCQTDPETCAPSCVAPPTCGEPCTGDAECGARAVCNTFLSGARKCVPDAFEASCMACADETGTYHCQFSGDACDVTCVYGEPEPPPDPPVGETDGGVAPPPVSCALCCDACAADADCCGGFTCDEAAGRCIPAECGGCPSGQCRFDCPPGAALP